MQIKHFALGLCFDTYEEENLPEERLWEEIFAVLSAEDMERMELYGGYVKLPFSVGDRPSFVAAFTQGSLKSMRRIYRKIAAAPFFCAHLDAGHPFLQSNVLEKVVGLSYFGCVRKDGIIEKETGPVAIVCSGKETDDGQPPKAPVLIVAQSLREDIPAEETEKWGKIAARRFYKNCAVHALPLAEGEESTVLALLRLREGSVRRQLIKGPDGGEISGSYIVLAGHTAVIAVPKVFLKDCEGYASDGIGLLIKRALLEGAKTIVLCCSIAALPDHGDGILRVLNAPVQGLEIIAWGEDGAPPCEAERALRVRLEQAASSLLIAADTEKWIQKAGCVLYIGKGQGSALSFLHTACSASGTRLIEMLDGNRIDDLFAKMERP